MEITIGNKNVRFVSSPKSIHRAMYDFATEGTGMDHAHVYLTAAGSFTFAVSSKALTREELTEAETALEDALVEAAGAEEDSDAHTR